jgi:DNA-binding protein H-NS
MPKINLDKMPLDELQTLQQEVADSIAKAKQRNRSEALAAIEATAQQMGFEVAELFGAAKFAKKAPKPPKYRHPENASVTWSGRGRQPAWIKDALAKGKSLDLFLIKA